VDFSVAFDLQAWHGLALGAFIDVFQGPAGGFQRLLTSWENTTQGWIRVD